MLKVVNLQAVPPRPRCIKTVTQILPLSQSLLLLLGHSPDSLRKLELVYEIYDSEAADTLRWGSISTFGIVFLTPYVNYDRTGCFLVLCSSMGVRRIISEQFDGQAAVPVVREIKTQKFEERAKREELRLYYSGLDRRIYLLEQLQFGEEEHQIIVRVYEAREANREAASYRIVALERQLPRVIFSPQQLVLACENEVALYSREFEPHYFGVENMEQFDILGYYQVFLLQLRADRSLFTMTLCGAIRPLLDQPVAAVRLAPHRLLVLTAPPQPEQAELKIFGVGAQGLKLEGSVACGACGTMVAVGQEQVVVGA